MVSGKLSAPTLRKWVVLVLGPRKLSLGPMHLLKLSHLTHLMSTNLSPSPLWSGNPKEKN